MKIVKLDAVNIYREVGNNDIVLLKCTSAYPAPLEDANLVMIPNLAQLSMDKQEFSDMIKAIRDTEKLLGKVNYSMTEKKKKSRQFSRSLYVAKNIKKGDTFTEENIRSVGPGYGMHPKYLKDVLGKIADKDFEFGDRFNMNTIEDKK